MAAVGGRRLQIEIAGSSAIEYRDWPVSAGGVSNVPLLHASRNAEWREFRCRRWSDDRSVVV